jgi:tripartite-type tricarboxylate transporter receptor subunit TctC
MNLRSNKRKWQHGVLFLFLMACFFGIGLPWVQAQDYPSKPIEVVVPFDPGGVVDITTRIIADEMSRELKTPLVIANVPGAGSIVGASRVLKAKPDGYTLLSTTTAMITSLLESPNPPFDPVKDFTPIGCYGSSPMIFGVVNSSPFKTLEELIDYARKNPAKLTCGVTSIGGENHLNFELFKKAAGVNIKIVPYKGSGEAVAALLGKHIDMMVLTYVSFLPYVKSGEARVLAITQKVPGSTLPTIAELGFPQVKIHMLLAFFVSAKTPKFVYDKLDPLLEKVVKDPNVAKKLENSGVITLYKAPNELTDELKDRWAVMGRLVEELGLKQK